MVYPFVTKPVAQQITLTLITDYGTTKDIVLPRQKPIQQIGILLTGTGINTTGSTIFNEDNPMNLFSKIQLLVNDTTPIRSLSGASLYFTNLVDYGVGNYRDILDTAGAGQTLSCLLLMDFKRNVKDKLDRSMLFPAHKFSDLRLRFTIGQLTALADTIAAYGTVTVTVFVTYLKELIVKPSWDILYQSEHPIPITVTSSGNYMPRDLEGMGQKIRRLILFCRDNSLRNDTLVTNIKIRDEQKEYEPYVMPWNSIKNLDISDYKLPRSEYYDGANSLPVWDELATASPVLGTIAGMAMVDFDKNLNMSNWYPAQHYRKGDLQLQYVNGAPTGTATLTYIIEYLRNEKIQI